MAAAAGLVGPDIVASDNLAVQLGDEGLVIAARIAGSMTAQIAWASEGRAGRIVKDGG
jgi:hypothetical protein